MIHPARDVEFDTLVEGLSSEIEQGNVTTTTSGQLTLYKYTQQCTYEKGWSQWSVLARGLILDHARRAVVATPFPKFFNYGEHQAALPDEPFEVAEKVDGSLAIIFHDGSVWRVVTRGSFTSEQSAWAEAWLRAHVTLSGLTVGATYLAEIVYPENRIVVRYDFAGLVLLGGYAPDGREFTRRELADVAVSTGLTLVDAVSCDGLDELLAVAKSLSSEKEGFVVRFASGLRLKIKGDEYCRIHRLVSRVTPLAVWEMLVAGDDLDAAARELPEEFRCDFGAIRAILEGKFAALLDAIAVAQQMTADMDDKALGLWLASAQTMTSPDVAKWIFPARKKNLMVVAHERGHVMRRRLCEGFRPTANHLDGYTASSLMNRFAAEAA